MLNVPVRMPTCAFWVKLLGARLYLRSTISRGSGPVEVVVSVGAKTPQCCLLRL